MRLSLAAVAVAVVVFGSIGGCAPSVHSDSPSGMGWSTSFVEASAEAKAQGKPMLVLFTGSDWCPPCMALERTVFESEVFRKWAKEKVVLVFLDFPNDKPQDEATKAQNKELAERYHVEAFPTVIFMSGAGEEGQRQMGYSGASPASWIENAEEAMKRVK